MASGKDRYGRLANVESTVWMAGPGAAPTGYLCNTPLFH